MRLKGIATITKWTIQEDGSMLETFRQVEENIINKRGVDSGFDGSIRIALSQQTTEPNFEEMTLGQITSVGNLVDNVFTVRTETEPSSLVYNNRFSPPPSDRTINSIGLVSGGTMENDANANTTRNSYTYLLLSSPVTQTTVEILDISYKILIDWVDSNLPTNFEVFFESQFFGQEMTNVPISFWDQTNRGFMISSLLSPYSGYTFERSNVGAIQDYSTTTGDIYVLEEGSSRANVETVGPNFNRYGKEERFQRGYNRWEKDVLSGEVIGRCVRGFIQGIWARTDTRPDLFGGVLGWGKYYASEILLNKASNLSNVWSHSETSTLPMYDINNLANSSWKPEITENTPTSVFNSLYYLKVMKSGGIGVGEYRLFKSTLQGWLNPATDYKPSGELFWTIDGNSAYQNEANTDFIWNYRWVYEWSKSDGVYEFATFRRKAGLAIIRITGETVEEASKFTLQEFTQLGSLINDIDVYPTDNYIYVATENGLYRITTTSRTITTISSDACATVCVGNAGQVFAVFRDGNGNGRLSSSTGVNWSTPLDLTGATINWDNVWRIFIDKDALNYDLMVYEGGCPKNTYVHVPNTTTVNTSSNKIHWWNQNDNFIKTDEFFNNVQTSTSSRWDSYVVHELLVLPNNTCVSVQDGVWIYPGRRQDATSVRNTIGTFGAYTVSTAEANDSLAIDIKIDAAEANRGWRDKKDSSSQLNTYGWNYRATNAYGSYTNGLLVGPSGDYNFGLHAETPYLTETFDGVLGSIYSLEVDGDNITINVLIGMNYRGGSSTTSGGDIANFFKVNIDTTDSNNNTVLDYTTQSDLYRNYTLDTRVYSVANFIKIGPGQVIFLRDPRNFQKEYQAGQTEPIEQKNPLSPRSFRHYAGGMGYVSLFRQPLADMDDNWVASYGWNGTAWVEGEPLNKTLHTTTEPLVDGLEIKWTDLAPTNTQDFVENQYYNFVKITEPNTVLVEENMPRVVGSNSVWSRSFGNNIITGVVPTTSPLRTYANESPDGLNPDELFLALPPDEETSHYSATIDGNKVEVVVDTDTEPPAGVIHINSITDGSFYFSAVDSGKPFTIQYNWVKKYHPTEVL